MAWLGSRSKAHLVSPELHTGGQSGVELQGASYIKLMGLRVLCVPCLVPEKRAPAIIENSSAYGPTVRFRKCATVPWSIQSATAPFPCAPDLRSLTIRVGCS